MIDRKLIDRLTLEEFSQVQAKKVGDSFYHINLQHSGIPVWLNSNKDKYVGLITKNGEERPGVQILPDLDFEHLIPVRLLSLRHSIPVVAMQEDYKKIPNLLLHNPQGIVESLCDKYTKVRGVTREQILQMDCFIREFRLR